MGNDNVTLATSGASVAAEYRVTINDYSGAVVQGSLQDKIQMKVANEWQPLGNSSVSALTNTELQLVGLSSKSQFGSHRLWGGTSPLRLTISLKFLGYSDGDVTSNLKSLLKMASPSSVAGILIPPGPSPIGDGRGGLLDEIAAGLKQIFGSGPGDQVSITIGKVLFFNSVIIQSVTVDIDNKFMRGGSPVFGEATIEFETYQVITKEDFSSIFLL